MLLATLSDAAMLLHSLSAATLVLAPATEVSAEFDGYRRRNDGSTEWERFDVVLANGTDEARSLSLCAADARQIYRTHRVLANPAFAFRFGDENWNHGCGATEIPAGQSVRIGVYFRPGWSFDALENGQTDRSILINTSLGQITFAYDFGFGDPVTGLRDIRAEFRPKT